MNHNYKFTLVVFTVSWVLWMSLAIISAYKQKYGGIEPFIGATILIFFSVVIAWGIRLFFI